MMACSRVLTLTTHVDIESRYQNINKQSSKKDVPRDPWMKMEARKIMEHNLVENVIV